ncbi:VanZF-related protein [Streptococcus oralis]|uniref:VanZF-related protein n=1 Tax=Streptococcus oralis TaxID=1303 RepID=A0A139PEJ1_STROR|nr:VanZF-related protein [Streptococcus oralis]
METPGIQTFGRLVFLLTPFNSFWKLGEVSGLEQLFWIFLQNALNVLLLFPLVFQLICLFPNLRRTKKVLLLSFCISLGIECTQLVLDFLFDFNRVFEIDDLWTNTLGGYLAWLLYKGLYKNKEIE